MTESDGPCVTVFFDYEGKWSIPEQETNSRMGVNYILSVLEMEGIRSTFNVVGNLIRDEEPIFKRIVAGGHEIASHTVAHIVVRNISSFQMQQDMEKFRKLLKHYTSNVIGFRGPKSGWSKESLNGLIKANVLWNAEEDSAPFPYVILSRYNQRLWRMPITIDDWPLEGYSVPPEEMLKKWNTTVDAAVERRCFAAIGFHPWVLAKKTGRLEAFSRFIKDLSTRKNLRVAPFGDFAKLCEYRLTEPRDKSHEIPI